MAKYNIYFGTYSKGEGNGLFRGVFDGDSGGIKLNDTVDISDPEKMRLIDIKPTHGKHPCHLCVKDDFAFAANYSGGSLSIFETDKAGGIKLSNQSIHHFGKGVNPGRQEASHIHFAAMTPDNKYLAVCDLGLDKVFLYPYSRETGLSTNAKIIDCPPGKGPRHLTFSNDGKYLYVVTEMGGTVLAYKYNGGDVELLQEISTLPSDFTGKSTCAAIHVSPYGKYLGASNRGHDSIAIFKIQDNGELAFLSHIMTGKEPRDFRFSPDGKFILSANQNDDTVTVYKIKNDKFTQTNSVSLPKPVCILFGEEIK